MAERVLTLKLVVDGSQSNAALSNYNNQMRQMAQNNSQAQSGIANLNNSFNQFNQVLNTAVLGISAMKILDFAADMNRLGQEVHIARQVFTQLAGGTHEAADMLELMQQKTGGVVDQLTLMHGASRLLQMGLADSKEEVAGLTEMAIKLGGALGMDANKSIEDFSLLLSNMSYLRLDQFGIAAGAVRTRVKELAEEFPNMSREARFAQAVLEEGQDAMNRLGDAANSSSTAMSRWETRVTNAMQQAGENINYATEQFLRFVEVITMDVPARNAEIAQQVAQQQANDMESIVNGLLGEGIQGNVGADRVANYVIEAIQQARENPEVWTNLDQFNRDIQQSLFQQNIQGPDSSSFSSQQEMDATMRLWLTYIAQRQALIEQERLEAQALAETYNSIEDMRADRNREAAEALNEQRQAAAELLSIEDMRAQRNQEIAEHIGEQRHNQALRDRSMELMGNFVGTAAQTGNFGEVFGGDWQAMQQYTTQQNAQDMEEMARQAQQYVDAMKEMQDAQGESFFSDEELDRAQEYADQIRGMADESQRMADALERASLSDLFGETSGGRVGEMSDAVIEYMRNSGMYTEDQINAARSTYDRASGRDTSVEAAFNDVLVPVMANMNPDEAARAMDNFNQTITTLAGAGVDVNEAITPENILNAAGVIQMGDGQPQVTIVAPGDTLSGIAGDLGLPLDQVVGMNPQISNPNLIYPGQEIITGSGSPGGDLAESFDPQLFAQAIIDAQEPAADIASNLQTTAEQSADFTGNMEAAAEHVTATRGELDLIVNDINTLTDTEQTVKLRFIVDASAIRLAINDALGQFQIGANSIRDNGGQAPGTNAAMRPNAR